MSGLRLGPIADDKPVKLTIELPGQLYRDLAEYAEVHARLTDLEKPLSPERLAVPMLARFMATDRQFAKERRRR